MTPIHGEPDSETDVLIVGAGPTGLTLAAALKARGVSTTVIDRLVEGANTSRAAVVHARTLEVLESLGVSARLARLGVHARASRFGIATGCRSRSTSTACRRGYPYTLMVSQAVAESVLLQRLVELGGHVSRPHALADLAQDPRGVTATLDDGTTLRARYLVGADGMHSIVRDRSGIAFIGGSYGESFVLADVRLDGRVPSDEVILYFSAAGLVVVAPLPEGVHRIVAAVDEAPEQPSAAYVQALLGARGPRHNRVTVRDVIWGSRFRVHHRVANVYRVGRVLLAGDAAHVHRPAGGQGMNAGILDAMTLADALTAALTQGQEAALDAYGARRRPIAEQIVSLADRLTRLATVRPTLRPLRNLLLSGVARLPTFRRRLAWQLSGLTYR